MTACVRALVEKGKSSRHGPLGSKADRRQVSTSGSNASALRFAGVALEGDGGASFFSAAWMILVFKTAGRVAKPLCKADRSILERRLIWVCDFMLRLWVMM